MTEYTVLHLPSKFVWLLKDAISHRMAQMQALLDDDNTHETVLEDMAYGNDRAILLMIQDDLDNPNLKIEADFYQISQNTDATESTLQPFGEPLAKDEKIVMVFSATSWEQAMAIKQQFLGFEPYKPL